MHFKSKSESKKTHTRGFSLLEVLITSAIIGIVTAIVVVRYGAFNSSVLLKNHAYEIALAIREAQVFSVSVRGDENEFRDKYGVYVDMSSGAAQELTVFLDTSSNGWYDGGDRIIETLVIDSRFEVTDVCVTVSGTPNCAGTGDIDDVSISFGRPVFDPKFYATGVVSPISDVTITLTPVSDDTISRTIKVTSTGQISVQ